MSPFYKGWHNFINKNGTTFTKMAQLLAQLYKEKVITILIQKNHINKKQLEH